MERIFSDIIASRSLADLNRIASSESWLLDSIADFEKKYPKEIGLKFGKTELADLVDAKLLTSEHLIDFSSQQKFSVLERLLLAILWKNGQLSRIRPVVDGALGKANSESDYGVIFRQFGKSLVDRNEPIVDQHVLRAFCHYTGRKRKSRSAAFTVSDQGTIDAYCSWFQQIMQNVADAEKVDFGYLLDKILFAVGKRIA